MNNYDLCVHISEQYHAGSDKPADMAKIANDVLPMVKDGITFFKVGHNASHEFYLGADAEDNLWKLSIGENQVRNDSLSDEEYERLSESNDINDATRVMLAWDNVEDEHIRKVNGKSDIGYIGHW